jgi:hypothetical protein
MSKDNTGKSKIELTDQVFQKMSEAAYSDYVTGEEIRILPGWEVLDQKHKPEIPVRHMIIWQRSNEVMGDPFRCVKEKLILSITIRISESI